MGQNFSGNVIIPCSSLACKLLCGMENIADGGAHAGGGSEGKSVVVKNWAE